MTANASHVVHVDNGDISASHDSVVFTKETRIPDHIDAKLYTVGYLKKIVIIIARPPTIKLLVAVMTSEDVYFEIILSRSIFTRSSFPIIYSIPNPKVI